MGREIRRVPPNWEHPRYTEDNARNSRYRPLYDEAFDPALRRWLAEYEQWRLGTHPDQLLHADETRGKAYHEWDGGPPDPTYYRPEWNEADATWWQAYETVSEGTPISPPFATAEELVHFLSTEKDFWGYGPTTRENAERFVRGGWAPSAIMGGGVFATGIDALGVLAGE